MRAGACPIGDVDGIGEPGERQRLAQQIVGLAGNGRRDLGSDGELARPQQRFEARSRLPCCHRLVRRVERRPRGTRYGAPMAHCAYIKDWGGTSEPCTWFPRQGAGSKLKAPRSAGQIESCWRMSGVNEIRSRFLDYFAQNGHAVVPSSPLVPRNDPTLMFTNAGMVQFKNVFTGPEKRPYSRAATAQKCVRAGGKHNDLDNVGYTARHHTFFEMLGNFSFGDYFKDRAIELAWNLITKEFGLSKDKLTATVYVDDDEAFNLWKKIAGLPDERIIGHESNLWAMGPVGPCGYCSEIFYDQGERVEGGPPGTPEEDGDRFLEFWNLVFMQFEQVTKEERVPLPRPSIDTGLGLERMACILQGVESVFETDLFRHLIEATASALGHGPEEQTVASFRVIADHLRSSAFLISDGVLPSNEGRGYVLRRIMRRAMRHAQLLGARDPLMHRLVWALVREV